MATAKYSLHQALEHLLGSFTFRTMGQNAVIIGTLNRYARISLQAPHVVGHYGSLTIDVFVNEQKCDTYVLKLNDPKYCPKDFSHPTLKAGEGGYYWNYDKGFYCYEPDLKMLTADINNILNFFEIIHKG